jgi:MFS superfamily sulfate permease-like transporter
MIALMIALMIAIILVRMVMHPTTIVVVDMRNDDKKCSWK